MLPTEILVYIFEYLDGDDIINLRETCRLFADVVKLVRCPKFTINYECEEDIVYGFTNCVLHNPMPTDKILHCNTVTCDFAVDDICKFNGVNTLIVYSKASNSGVVDIKNVEVWGPNFVNFNENFKNVETLKIRKYSTIRSIESLPNLKSLSIGYSNYNIFGGVIISNLPSLEELMLLGCEVMHISNLDNLKRLTYNYHLALNCIDNMTKLEKLEIACPIYQKEHDLSNHIHLRHLQLARGNVTCPNVLHTLDLEDNLNVNDLSKFTELRHLIIRNTYVKDISTLTNLEVLDATSSQIKRLPENNKIHTLMLCFNNRIRRLRNIDNVETIRITNSTVSKLSRRNKIKYISAYLTPLKNAFPFRLATSIDIRFTNVTKLPLNMPNVTYLDISNTGISKIHNCPKLLILKAKNTKLSDVSHLTTLVELHAYDSLIKDVSNLTNLRKTKLGKRQHDNS